MPKKKVTTTNQHQLGNVKSKKWKLVEEYCENSTVHGLRYFSKQDIHLFERYIFWKILVKSLCFVHFLVLFTSKTV